MNIKLESTSCKEGRLSTYIIDTETGEFVGSAEGHVGRRNELVMVIKVNPLLHKKGIGFSAFNLLFNCLSKTVVIDSIVGAWYEDEEFSYLEGGMSTNLLVFQRNLDCGMSVEEAALNTPTGKWASKVGYNHVTIESCNSKKVEVLFSK